jgi:ankyrin repeat protein
MKAWEHILTNRGGKEELAGLKRLFSTEILDDFEFTYLHKLVIGLLPLRLEQELEKDHYKNQIDLVDFRKQTPLHWAATRGDEHAVRALLAAGANPNAVDSEGATPVILAASAGSIESLRLLLQAGADIQAKSGIGNQALHGACRHQSNVAVIRLLMEHGASLECQNKKLHTPLVGAAITNRVEIGRELLNRGANMRTKSIHGDTPVFETIFHNNHDFLNLLISYGVKWSDINGAGSSILHAAALEGDLETVKILTAAQPRGLVYNAKNSRGLTAWNVLLTQRQIIPDGFEEALANLLTVVKEHP